MFLTELDEALEIADRILVMSEHTIVGEHINENPDVDLLLANRRQAARGACMNEKATKTS